MRNLAVQSWFYYFQYLKRPKHYVLSFIQAHCVSLSPSAETGGLVFGPLPYIVRPKQGPYEGSPPNQACPPGEIAVGIRARTDLYNHFIYGIGLICGPPPSLGAIPTQVNPLAVKPHIATKVNPLATAPEFKGAESRANPYVAAPVPSVDMFAITRPAWNDRVPQGRLIVTAKAPKIGVTPVTELQFKWLDAPPNQPYVNTFAIDTSELLQGYPVDPRVTRAYTGRWEVRARASGKAVPGPWSFPVGFQLFLTQPTQSQKQSSPIQQTAPLPSSSVAQPSMIPQTDPLPSSSIMQAPAPSSSAPTQMRRSPSMIMPRGVDEKPAPESHQTVDTSPKPEKKP